MKVLVILGNKLSDNGSMSEILADRLEKVLEVEPQFDILLLSGGVANNKSNASEANIMKDFLLENGCQKSKIILENLSMTTKQNAQFCAPIIEKLKVKNFTILTSAYHIKRKILNPIKLFEHYTNCTVDYIEA